MFCFVVLWGRLLTKAQVCLIQAGTGLLAHSNFVVQMIMHPMRSDEDYLSYDFFLLDKKMCVREVEK